MLEQWQCSQHRMRTVQRRIYAAHLTIYRGIMEQLEQVEIDAFPTAFVTYLNVRRASSYLVNPLGTSSEYHSLMAAKFNSMHDTALFVTQTHNVVSARSAGRPGA
jgi:hypothetical protein